MTYKALSDLDLACYPPTLSAASHSAPATSGSFWNLEDARWLLKHLHMLFSAVVHCVWFFGKQTLCCFDAISTDHPTDLLTDHRSEVQLPFSSLNTVLFLNMCHLLFVFFH